MDPSSVPDPLSHANPAPGGPGVAPSWTRADKDGLGTAMSWSSQVWYTMAKGVITELYFPDVDTPQVRDLQFLVTDGANFFHDPKVDYKHKCEPIVPEALAYRLTNTAIGQPYTMIHDVISEPGASSVLIRTKLQGDPNLLPRLRVYALLAPHIEGAGANNSGFVARTRVGNVLTAHRNNTWLAMGVDCGFRTTSCGYVGVNDGWQDIIRNRRLPAWNYDSVFNGNIALTGEIDLNGRTEFVLAVAFSDGDDATPNASLTALFEALSQPFEAPAGYSHLGEFLKTWQTQRSGLFQPTPNATCDAGRLFNTSCNVLLAHEDKQFNGALVASMSIPWGEANGDSAGGYHLVWPRDMSQSAGALLAAGQTDLPLRGLLFLAATQQTDGTWNQNFYINGKGHWLGTQLDEYSFAILLAYRLRIAGALQFFDPRSMVLGAAGALIARGPASPQERWEENAGYSPSTLAANIAALVCAADFASQKPADQPTAQFLLDYADFLESNLERWLVTTTGELLAGVPRHYIRLLPTGDPAAPEQDPNTATIDIRNLSGPSVFPARNIVDGGFLELVRYGIRAAGDQLIEDSLRVVDASIKDNLPGGPCWRRYTHDGYGQTLNGGPFLDVGVGRPWPLLTGERGHYEFAAGRDPSVYLQAMEAFAGSGCLLAEQLWNEPDLDTPSITLRRGGPTGSAMPLAWAHAEYIKLVRSISDAERLGLSPDKAIFDRVQIVADRYLKRHAASRHEIWNWNRQIPTVPRGKTLRIQSAANFQLHWSRDGWATVQDTNSTSTAVGICYVDIATDQHTLGPLKFTFYWPDTARWEGRDYSVSII